MGCAVKAGEVVSARWTDGKRYLVGSYRQIGARRWHIILTRSERSDGRGREFVMCGELPQWGGWRIEPVEAH